MCSSIHCDMPLEEARLTSINDGPLFADYELDYHHAQNRRYALKFRCYKLDPYIRVSETFSLGMNAKLAWTINPENLFTHIISRDSFEGESQPTIEPLSETRPRDVLCRLQMPVICSMTWMPSSFGPGCRIAN